MRHAAVKSLVMELLNKGHRIVLPVSGNSMKPAFRSGDALIVEPCSFEILQKGDVVVYRGDNGGDVLLVAHRVTEKKEGPFFLTAGDADKTRTSIVHPHQVLGRVVQIKKKSFLSRWLAGLDDFHPRLWWVVAVHRLAHAVEFFSVALASPPDFVEGNRRYYAGVYGPSFDAPETGLLPFETSLLSGFESQGKRALVLGCGDGREALALARRGWCVVGIDSVSGALEKAEVRAKKEGLAVDWICRDVVAEGFPHFIFDVITLLGQLYSLVPSRHLRVAFLQKCRERLHSEGRILVGFIRCAPPSRHRRLAQRVRKGLGWICFGNRESQVNDRLYNGRLFIHPFVDLSELEEEALEAGLCLDQSGEVAEGEVVVLKPKEN